MKTLIYKLKFIFSNPLSILWKMLLNASSFLGFATTVLSAFDTINKNDLCMKFLCNNFCYFIVGSLLLSLILSVNWIPVIDYKIHGTDSSLSIKVGDITTDKGSIIISTNTSFVTTMKDEIISPKSAQGSFQNRYFKNNLDELDKKIATSLSAYSPRSSLKLNCSKKSYPVYDVGTVSKIRHNNRNVYFLALNDINAYGQNENRKSEDFYTSLDKLWLYIRQMGNTEEAAIHLFGSGRAGLNITKEESLKEIVKSYIGQAQNYKILSKLTVYIYPTDLEYIDIKVAKKYVENQCLFAEIRNTYNGKAE